MMIPQEFTKQFEWLVSGLSDLQFGQIGLTFVLHDGQIVRVCTTLEESQKNTPKSSQVKELNYGRN